MYAAGTVLASRQIDRRTDGQSALYSVEDEKLIEMMMDWVGFYSNSDGCDGEIEIQGERA